MTPEDRRMQELEDRFRSWAQRPPETAPDEAARRVTARLTGRPSSFRPWHGLAAAAVLALVIAASWLLVFDEPTPSTPTLQAEATDPVHPTDSDQVLMWLDESTPLYMTFAPSGQEGKDS